MVTWTIVTVCHKLVCCLQNIKPPKSKSEKQCADAILDTSLTSQAYIT
jgi:hypothetical protein